MKITESSRKRAAWELVEKISTYAQSLNPKRDWEQSYKAVVKTYQIAHSIRAPQCRKNHPDWIKEVDDVIRAEKSRRPSDKR